jgi:ABC-type enterobactin transport system permease subunit
VLVAMVLFGQNLTAIALAAMAGGVLTKAHHVRAAERVTGQRLENGAADAERGADEQRH